tara:strand:- start:976 stop:1152 length:177 start_codon:yes stop_codon:yes gene_type:complete
MYSTTLKTPTRNVSFNQLEVDTFRQYERDLIRKTRLSVSSVYKIALEEYWSKHFPRQR